jgi:NADH:ubiquinone oxidoreductase subunit 5 (subunit L)/multisubunit Na+/H+ antiporter MnhA subunit
MFDSLTVCMSIVVTFVSLLVHLYSTEYMSHDLAGCNIFYIIH